MNRSTTTMLVGALVLPAVSLVSLAGPQNPSQPAFRDRVDLVHVDVAVLDKDRRPVRGLTAVDFTVLEDGKPRPIAGFAAVELPARATTPESVWTREIPSDVATNQIAPEGRIVAIVFDWSIRFMDQPAARRIAKAAIDAMGPGDLGTVIFTGGFSNGGTVQNLTADKARLYDAVNRPMTPARVGSRAPRPLEPRRRSTVDGVTVADDQPRTFLFDPDGARSGDCFCRVCTYDKVGDVADALAPVAGRRKTMLFIGTYFPPPSPPPMAVCRDHVVLARERTARKLSLASVTIHVVDPVGLAAADNGPVPATRADADPGDPIEMDRQTNLPFFAHLTGGRSVMNDNAPERMVPAILDESGAYYVLAFSSTDPGRDTGRLHRIDVRVARRDVSVQARSSYQAGETAAARESAARKAPLVTAVESTLPRTDLLLSLTAMPFATPGKATGTVAVVVRTDPPAPDAARPSANATAETTKSDNVSAVIAAVDPQGKILAAVKHAAVVPWPVGASGPGPYEFLARLELEPGRYEIRAATDVDPATRSSVYGFVEVPDFRKLPLSLSGIAIQVVPTGMSGPKGVLAQVMPIVPTTRRQFTNVERVTAFVQVYRAVQTTTATTMTARILDSAERTVIESRDELSGSEYHWDLPVEKLPAGEYVLELSSSSGADSASRRVRFSVR
ncbi:MAG: VWA domain-containing protein [Vicinamibacterales bacterium]